ncbi:hypothetical protein T4D_11208 [Trichinella pseudospiralis]|uniref:Uncharacterized protein n=1 Tax=Trichinella pseudospiralis TaxID=6337 RepID=A0A0V1FZS4_TRIPS|nr:hypothetical protein T4D_11208 [Trichinella pseudospiralis]
MPSDQLFNSMNVNEDLVGKKQTASKNPVCHMFKLNTYNIYDSLKVISALSFVGQQGKMKQVTTTTPPSPTRQATVYCISVLRRGFSSPRDVVIISVAGMIRCQRKISNVHEHSVMVFNTEKRFAIYLKGVTKNDKVYNFKQHYVTCIAIKFVDLNF